MRLLAPVWLVLCAFFAICNFNQGDTVYGLYFTILTMITAESILRE